MDLRASALLLLPAAIPFSSLFLINWWQLVGHYICLAEESLGSQMSSFSLSVIPGCEGLFVEPTVSYCQP